jgi:hypothetical protein
MLAALLAVDACAATMPPVRMKVVDAEDGRPVAGANVLFHASAREGTFTGHGGRSVSLFAAEAVTDDAGELRLPRQEFSPQPFFLNTNYDSPSLLVFKPGYALVLLRNNRPDPGLRDMTLWEHNQQTIRMKRGGDREMADALYSLEPHASQAMVGDRRLCGWKNFPRFLVALDRAATDWNRRRDSLADRSLSYLNARSPLQFVLQNDQVFIEKGCGSPKAFFEPYLR